MDICLNLCIFIMLLGAVAFDLKSGKIPNRYNGFWLGCGLIIRLVLAGGKGLVTGLIGVLIPVLGLMIMFRFGIVGAGDIKLFGAVGAFVGLDVIWIVMYSFVACGIFGGSLMLVRFVKGMLDGNIGINLIGILTNNRKYTRVAFSVFILGGFGWYLLKGGMILGI